MIAVVVFALLLLLRSVNSAGLMLVFIAYQPLK
jgi:hypothetical protein